MPRLEVPDYGQISVADAIALQEQLRQRVVCSDDAAPIRTVAGIDIGIDRVNAIARAAVVVMHLEDLAPVEWVLIDHPVTFPYVPGLLGFREVPAAMAALARLSRPPDLLMCDGHGIAHPRRCGLACHLGLVAGMPAIGVAKSRLIGNNAPLDDQPGAWQPLYDGDEVIGRRIVEELKWARDAMFDLVKWTGQLPFPDFEQPYEFVALRHPGEYPFNEGRLVSNRGLDIPISAFEEFMIEEHLPHSTSLHARIKDRGAYFVGPLARYNLNFDRLSPLAQEAACAAGLGPTCYNPFQSIIVRGVETLYAIDEALRILETYPEPDAPYVPYAVRAGVGHGCTEAPRGILYHRYVLDDNGLIVSARITPPTAQNQATIEADLRAFVEPRVYLPLNELTWQCEQAIRNYDPCISCSTHFLRVQVERD